MENNEYNRLIYTNKLIDLVGDDLVIFLDDYLEYYRGSKKKSLKPNR